MLDVTLRSAQKCTSFSFGRVLIVDDAADNRTLLHHYIRRMGYETVTAASGRLAVESALKGDFDVVLMDVEMPDMDGFETLRVLRERGYDKPVLVLTANTVEGERERCLKAGFNDYLAKPVERENLRSSLEQHSARPANA